MLDSSFLANFYCMRCIHLCKKCICYKIISHVIDLTTWCINAVTWYLKRKSLTYVIFKKLQS